jgi:hypothetical protein
MKLESEISNLRSKHQVERLIRWIGTDTKRFAQLMRLFFQSDQDISRRSAWVVGHCCERSPELAGPWLKAMIKKIQEPHVHTAIQRSVMRVLNFVEIPRSLTGTVVNICFHFISDTKTAIAPQAFAVTIVSNIAQKEPELLKELRVLVRRMLPYSTAAFRARAKKIFKDFDLREEKTCVSKDEEDQLLHEWLMKKK